MSLTVKAPLKSGRDREFTHRRQSVFAFIATSHLLDAEGCFNDSLSFIAERLGCSYEQAKYAFNDLKDTHDLLPVETTRRDAKGRLSNIDAKGKPRPNRVRPVPLRTFWEREHIRQTTVWTAPTCPHDAEGCSSLRTKSVNQQGLTPDSGGAVPTVSDRGHTYKSRTQDIESLYFNTVYLKSRESLSTASVPVPTCLHCNFDTQVANAIASRLKELEAARTELRTLPPFQTWNIERCESEIARIEKQIAILMGVDLKVEAAAVEMAKVGRADAVKSDEADAVKAESPTDNLTPLNAARQKLAEYEAAAANSRAETGDDSGWLQTIETQRGVVARLEESTDMKMEGAKR